MSGRSFDTHHPKTWQRDRLVAVAEYTGVLASGLAESAGYISVERSARAVARLLSEYRCITRICSWLVVLGDLSPAGVRRIVHASPGIFTVIARIATTVALGLFLLSEEVALLAAGGVVRGSLRPYAARLVPIFFFFYNLLKMATSVALLRATKRISFEATDTQSVIRKRRYKELFVTFMEGTGYMIYAMTLLPTNTPRLTQALREERWVDRSYAVLSSLCPQAVRVSSTTQGIIGLVATIPSFFGSS
ncbi:Gim5A protein [Trypanosoma grayi]|uniref:Gim5A protein n=1 Tax=Trypanosoma grayi TaxID=71804 RepID=UPI0004F44D27|nr:Gim5A protein [Trypanosoma grayi]KEG13349.1 Gim5A protein [Trypanosoma grayi]